MLPVRYVPLLTVPPPPAPAPARSLLSIADLDAGTFGRLVRRAGELLRDRRDHDRPLAGAVTGLLFTRTSTRTRTAFASAVLRLGGELVSYGPGDLQTNTGETIEDTARVFGRMLDGLVVRTAGPLAQMRALARSGGLPVINAMAAEEHPTQAICDVATIALSCRGGGPLRDVRVLYVGEGNNTATALARAMALVPGSTTTFATPPGYGLPAACLAEASARGLEHGALLREVNDMAEVGDDYHVVYTTRWQTTGTAKQDPDWRAVFAPFRVDGRLMARFPDAVFMHDLPAHRGEEVEADVLDGPRSLAWLQAEVKLAGAMAVLEWAVGRGA